VAGRVPQPVGEVPRGGGSGVALERDERRRSDNPPPPFTRKGVWQPKGPVGPSSPRTYQTHRATSSFGRDRQAAPTLDGGLDCTGYAWTIHESPSSDRSGL
jgi:hypothetical protein